MILLNLAASRHGSAFSTRMLTRTALKPDEQDRPGRFRTQDSSGCGDSLGGFGLGRSSLRTACFFIYFEALGDLELSLTTSTGRIFGIHPFGKAFDGDMSEMLEVRALPPRRSAVLLPCVYPWSQRFMFFVQSRESSFLNYMFKFLSLSAICQALPFNSCLNALDLSHGRR